MIVLHLESLGNSLFELNFLIFQETCFYGQTFSGRGTFLHDYEFFSSFLLFSIY